MTKEDTIEVEAPAEDGGKRAAETSTGSPLPSKVDQELGRQPQREGDANDENRSDDGWDGAAGEKRTALLAAGAAICVVSSAIAIAAMDSELYGDFLFFAAAVSFLLANTLVVARMRNKKWWSIPAVFAAEFVVLCVVILITMPLGYAAPVVFVLLSLPLPVCVGVALLAISTPLEYFQAKMLALRSKTTELMPSVRTYLLLDRVCTCLLGLFVLTISTIFGFFTVRIFSMDKYMTLGEKVISVLLFSTMTFALLYLLGMVFRSLGIRRHLAASAVPKGPSVQTIGSSPSADGYTPSGNEVVVNIV